MNDQMRRDAAPGAPCIDALGVNAFFDASPVPAFVIDAGHVVTHINGACAVLLGITPEMVIGKRDVGRHFYGHARPVLADLIVDGTITQRMSELYEGSCRTLAAIPDAYQAEAFFPRIGPSGRWLVITAAALRTQQGVVVGAIETLQDITATRTAVAALLASRAEVESLVVQRTRQLAQSNEALRGDVLRRESVERELLDRNAELGNLNAKLSMAQEHLVQSEKLASIGQLAAGVAHEINNPIGYIFSNFGTLERYLVDLFRMLDAYETAEATHGDDPTVAALHQMRTDIDMEFLKQDIPALMRESREGIVRVRKIVQDLKDFSHVDTRTDWQFASLNQGIDSTLNVVNNELKYRADVVKEYGNLPDVQCIPSQINQVVMNLVVNAAHAMGPERGTIIVRTGVLEDAVWIEVEDTGSGIAREVLPRIFDPFYTTKPVGKGTGLGLSLSYGIIQRHGGRIDVRTEEGRGSAFRVSLPMKQAGGLIDMATAPAP
jgi:two-component system NtrC family sensor kinase